jgi:hypothetical protein
VKRMERTVYLKLFEVKFHDSGEEVKRDTTCVVIANNTEQIAKTPTIYQSDKPLFLEDFEFTDFQCSQKINSLTILGTLACLLACFFLSFSLLFVCLVCLVFWFFGFFFFFCCYTRYSFVFFFVC